MRTSKDIYKLPNGEFVAIDQMTQPPQNAINCAESIKDFLRK